MGAEDQILALMRMRGPILPVDAAKAIKTNILFASAHLSELASRQKVKISSLKFGGSPVYYLPEHASRLQDFAKNLDEKEYRAFERLRDGKVLRDSELDPLTRVALREIKDFAVPLMVSFGGGQELFWKWYLLSDEEARPSLGQMIEPKMEEVKREIAEPQLQMPVQQAVVQELQQTLAKPIRELKQPAVQVQEAADEPKTFAQKLRKKRVAKLKETTSSATASGLVDFESHVKSFFKNNNIAIASGEVKRKGAEMDYVIKLPSAMGALTYFCKVKNKKRCDDKDLSSALVDGQLKKMPVVLVYTGSLTPKAQELAKTDMFKTMVFYSLKYGD